MVPPPHLVRQFVRAFGGKSPAIFARAPGRVNLIGAHIDYNEGFVLPAAVDRFVSVLARPRPDRRVRLLSLTLGERAEFQLDSILPPSRSRWAAYPMGVAKLLEENGVLLPGLDLLVHSDVPIGAGLGSSAALEVATALAFLLAARMSLVPRDLARICQMAENEFVGVKCGIMDQFASLFGRKGHCLFLDCRYLDYDLISFPEREFRIVVCDTLMQRDLADAYFNRRRRECEDGVRRLRAFLPGIESLRDVSPAAFREYGSRLPPVIGKRCAHAVGEIARARRAAKKLKEGDLHGFGRLMFASHSSSRDLYEVSCPELDLLVRTARRVPGAVGARLTGGGFGGCTVNLVEKGAVEKFRRAVSEAYSRGFGQDPGIYVCRPSSGATAESL